MEAWVGRFAWTLQVLAGALLASGLSACAPPEAVPVAPSAPTPARTANLDHGERLARHVLACTACHGDDLGGGWVPGDPEVGRVWAPNLTRGVGGVARPYEGPTWDRAIRAGIAADGRELAWHPTARWRGLTGDDVHDLVSALATWAPVDRVPQDDALGMGVRLAGGWVDDDLPPAVGAPWGPTAAYGAYLSTVAGCTDCHGADLAGRRARLGGPAAPPIDRAALGGWTGTRFARAVVEGRREDGPTLHETMPWRAYAGLHPTELDALWLHLRPGPSMQAATR